MISRISINTDSNLGDAKHHQLACFLKDQVSRCQILSRYKKGCVYDNLLVGE